VSAEAVNTPVRAETQPKRGSPAKAVVVGLAGWLVPGLGHALTGRWKRGVVYFCAVAAMVVTGYLQRGFVFSPHFSDAFGLLGFIADLGTGAFYFVWKLFETAGPDIARAAGDYGTRFIATAGVVNMLCALDAFAIALGEKD
jgi:hypothetical protein